MRALLALVAAAVVAYLTMTASALPDPPGTGVHVTASTTVGNR